MAWKKRGRQHGGGKYLSMPNLAGNAVKRIKKTRNKKHRKLSHGKKGGKKNRSTQIATPVFMPKSSRNRHRHTHSKPLTGIYNDMPSVQDRPSKMKPQQVAWGS